VGSRQEAPEARMDLKISAEVMNDEELLRSAEAAMLENVQQFDLLLKSREDDSYVAISEKIRLVTHFRPDTDQE
jgi:hypothetical protein